MSKSSVFISAFLSLCYVSTSFAALALGPAQVHPSQPNFCFQETKNKFYKPGETWTLEGCMQAECVMVSNSTGTPHLMVSYASCGVAAVDPPCYLTENKAAAYPDCCPEPVCPDSAEEMDVSSSPVEPSSSSSSSSSTTKQSSEQREPERQEQKGESLEDSSENEVVTNGENNSKLQESHQYQSSVPQQQQQPQSQEQFQRRILTEFFRNLYPWDDDYLYGDHDHMDNHVVDDLQYLDYFPQPERSLVGSRGRFSRHDFNINNFDWF